MVPPTFAGDALSDNPFGYLAVVGTNGLLLFEVEDRGHVDYAWLEVTEVNVAYELGQTDVATFERDRRRKVSDQGKAEQQSSSTDGGMPGGVASHDDLPHRTGILKRVRILSFCADGVPCTP